MMIYKIYHYPDFEELHRDYFKSHSEISSFARKLIS